MKIERYDGLVTTCVRDTFGWCYGMGSEQKGWIKERERRAFEAFFLFFSMEERKGVCRLFFFCTLEKESAFIDVDNV